MYCTKNEVFHFPADLVTFTEEILNGKLHFLCSVLDVCRSTKYTSASDFPSA